MYHRRGADGLGLFDWAWEAESAEAARRNVRGSFRNLRDRYSLELGAQNQKGETPHDELNRLI